MTSKITFDAAVMGGRPCIRGMRVTVGTLVGLVATGYTREKILELYPYLEPDGITEALRYASWRAEEIEVPFSPARMNFSASPLRPVGSAGVPAR